MPDVSSPRSWPNTPGDRTYLWWHCPAAVCPWRTKSPHRGSHRGVTFPGAGEHHCGRACRARETCERLGRLAARVVCLATPEPFNAVGLWYEQFSQTTDEEVTRLLASADGVVRPASSSATTRPAKRSEPVEMIRRRAHKLEGDPSQYDTLLKGIGDARVVLLGEASHGTHEFYRERAFITRRLIAEKGFTAVAVEADWPDAYRVNWYVCGAGADEESVDALGDFGRFPTWMWGTPMFLISSAGFARTTRPSQRSWRRLLRPRFVQPARVDAGGAGLSRESRSGGRPAGADALCLLRSLRRRDPGVCARKRIRAGAILRARGRHTTHGPASSQG